MDITTVRSSDFGNGYGNTQASGDSSSSSGVAVTYTPITDNGTAAPSTTTENTDNSKNQKQLKKEDLQHVTKELSDFMESMNTSIRFQLHDKTKELMVQVVDTKDNRVLKEFPPHELLDTIAAIREYVGIILDKKA